MRTNADPFPLPFSGIDYVVELDAEQLPDMLTYLATGCGHQHNFAVQTDAKRPAIWTTSLGTQCIWKRSRG